MNSLVVSGLVSSGVVLRTGRKGDPVANFEITEHFNRHTIAAWGVMADKVKDYQIGDYLVICGRLNYSSDAAGKGFANIHAVHIEVVKEDVAPNWEPTSDNEPLPTVQKKGVY